MSADTWAGIIVRYVDGNENRFAFQAKEDQTQAVARFEEAIQAQMLILEMEDRVMLIPFHRIKSIEVMPKGGGLPRYALQNVRLIS